MSARFAVAGAVALVIAGVAFFASHVFDAGTAQVRPSTAGTPSVTSESSAPNEAAAAVDGRREVSVAAPIIAASHGTKLHGVVLEITGATCGGVAIEHRVGKAQRLVARSDDAGAFEAVIDELEGVLTVGDGAWTCITPCKLSPARREQSHVLVVGRAMALTGRVVDERGDGVARAAVGVRMTVEIKSSLPKSLDEPSDALAVATCDETGGFKLQRFARVPGARLQANSAPLQPHGQPLPLGDEPVLIVLRDPDDAKLVYGIVVDSANQPLAAVEVSLGGFSARPTEADGVFRFPINERLLPKLEPSTALEAHLDGFQSAHVDGFARLVLDASGPLPSQRIVLVAPDLHIRGRVLDASGQPAELESITIDAGPTSEATSPHFDGAGAFDVRGLCEGEYVLACVTRTPRVRFKSEPIRAGSNDVVLRVPADALVERVLGRVVTPDGSVVSNAQVGVALGGVFAASDPVFLMHTIRDPVTCDTAGGFELREVPRHEGLLVVSHPSIVTTAVALDGLDLSSDLRIVVPRVSFLRIEGVAEHTSMMGLTLLDGQRRTVRIKRASDGAILDNIVTIRSGKSDTLALAEGHYTLVLGTRAGEAASAREIDLVGGETLVVRVQ